MIINVKSIISTTSIKRKIDYIQYRSSEKCLVFTLSNITILRQLSTNKRIRVNTQDYTLIKILFD
jgi:hypothetical protein